MSETMSGSRATFPHALDRETIHCFLMGLPQNLTGLSGPDGMGCAVYCEDGKLRIANHAVLAASWDSGGALVCHPLFPWGITTRLANYMLQVLGVPEDQRIKREHVLVDGVGVGNDEYVLDGRILRTNDPITLCGPMSVEAYRAMYRGKVSWQDLRTNTP